MAGFDLQQARQRATQVNGAFTTSQKVVMGVAAAVVVAGVFMMTRISSEPDWATLYADLGSGEAAAVTERLAADGIDYRLVDGGSTIQVPRDELYETRIALSADGMPGANGQGWSILDDQGITSSEFSQRVGYQRALEGELARTVRAIDGVQSAIVHLALPRDTAFALDDRDASASVMITTAPGITLDPGQVQAVVNVVASSVEGLPTEAVTVADSTGMVLAAPGQGVYDMAGGEVSQRRTRAFESQVASDLTSMLAAVVGPGKAVVNVSADLNFDETSVTRETFTDPVTDPAGERVPLGERTRTEEYVGSAPGTAGILGPEGEPAAEGSETNYNLDERDVTFAVNRVVESTNEAPGRIERMSVAVLVDEAVTTAPQIDQIEELVTAGAGVDLERGDSIAVTRMPFDTSVHDAMTEAAAEAERAAAADQAMNLYRELAIGLLVVAVMGIAYLKIRKARRARAALGYGPSPALRMPAPLPLAPAPAGVPADLAAQMAAMVGGGGTPGTAVEPAHSPAITSAAPNPVAAEVAQMIDNQPDEVAALLRTWLGDRRAVRR
ncbi:MAG TPA: flagellar basal-body MS-ring/collar protein FliF [Acidimicrobiales bacterium]|nr:flagellar basal-body MS-ring/collar protein FliF [Acidimicrobiales bacterium]